MNVLASAFTNRLESRLPKLDRTRFCSRRRSSHATPPWWPQCASRSSPCADAPSTLAVGVVSRGPGMTQVVRIRQRHGGRPRTKPWVVSWLCSHAAAAPLTIAFGEVRLRCLRRSSKHRSLLSPAVGAMGPSRVRRSVCPVAAANVAVVAFASVAPFLGRRYRRSQAQSSSVTSVLGCEQHTRTRPSGGGSSGFGL